MRIEPIYLSLAFLFLLFFSIAVILHKRRLNRILTINDVSHLKKAENLAHPHLGLANFVLVAALVSVALAILSPQLSSSNVISFMYFMYKDETALITDLFFFAFVTIIFVSTYPLAKKQEYLVHWLEVALGFIVGTDIVAIQVILYIINNYTAYSLHQLSAITIVSSEVALMQLGFIILSIYLFLPFIILAIGALSRQPYVIVGAFLGAIYFFSAYILLLSRLLFVFLITFMFITGVLIGAIYVLGQAYYFWALPVFFIFLYFYNPPLMIPFYFAFFLGLATFLVFALEPNLKIKLTLVSVFGAAYCLLYLFTPEFMFFLVFLGIFAVSELFTAELFKVAERSVLFKWLLLTFRSRGLGTEVRLSEHEGIPNFKKCDLLDVIEKKSALFTYLSHLIVKPLRASGFIVNVAEEELKRGNYTVTCVRDISVRIDENQFRVWEDRVMVAIKKIKLDKQQKISIKKLVRESELTVYQVKAVLMLSELKASSYEFQ
ncbi:MAG: hypothetical protein ACP6IU_10165 [Candidatus Asgardarchaeia archaeon]